MKKNNLGFMLAETLLVTAFVAAVLIYLFLQFYNLNDEYNNSYKYNSVEGLYALEDVVDFIQDDPFALSYINNNISELRYIDISNCSLFTDSFECKKLLKLENIDEIIITTNNVPTAHIKDYSTGFTKFLNKIYATSTEPYRVVASFKNGTYATVRFNNTLYEKIKSPILENGVTVILNPNDGSFNTIDKQVDYNEPYGMLITPTRKGYTFDGWYNNIVKVTTFEDNHKISSTGEYEATNENYMATPYLIPVRGGVTLYSNIAVSAIYSYDSGGNLIRKESSFSSVHPISDNAVYIRIEVRKDAGDFNYYLNNLVINEYQSPEVLDYVNSAITVSTINKIYQNHMLYAKWLPKGATYVRDNHVIANYDMKHRNNNTLIDLSQYNRNATVNNGTWGYDYLQFDGSSTWVNLGQINSNNQTLEVTFKLDYAPTDHYYLIGNWETGGGGIIIMSDGSLYGNYYINGSYRSITSNTKIEVGKKYHVALTYDGEEIKLYINAGLESKYQISGNITTPTNNTVMAIGANPVGSNAESNYFKGKIYNAAVHDVAISENQIAIDAETTGLYIEKETYIEDDFIDWSLTNSLAGEAYKGIIYLDPTDITATCNATLASQNVNENGTPTGINSGCMKFYIYDDSGINYKLILDHNTSGNVAWNSDGTTNNGYNEVGLRLASDTQGWTGNPRLITANELAKIVGADKAVKFDSSKPFVTTSANPDTQSSWLYFDGSGNTYAGWQTQVASASNKSKYAWLYDYTANCEQRGCNVQDNNQYSSSMVQGYWTSTAVSGSTTSVWRVFKDGDLHGLGAHNTAYVGVRPVITIPKVVINGEESTFGGTKITSNNGLLSLGGNSSNAIASKKYNINGGEYSVSFDAYTNTIRTGYNTGYLYALFGYLDSSNQPVISDTGDTENEYQDSITLNTWNSITNITRGSGSNIKYLNLEFIARDDISSMEYQIRNFKITGNKIPNTFYIIKVHTTSNIGVTAIKYAKGAKDINYFEENGLVADGNEITVTENGTYTVYIIDAENNEVIKTINITDIN